MVRSPRATTFFASRSRLHRTSREDNRALSAASSFECLASDGTASLTGDETPAAGDDDETFLEEEEEDGPDVSGIIGGPVTEPEEGT